MNQPKETKKPELHVSKEDIITGLRQLGLKKGDAIGVHSSLSSFGYVKGGVDAVIDALLEVVGKEGTIVMPTHSANLQKVERSPEEFAAGVSWLFKILPYDPETTPCTTGTIPETFRKRKGVLRSLHHAHSVAATGPLAKEITQAGNKNVLEAWRKLLQHNGYILLLGTNLGNCTAMHLVEERVTLPKHLKDKLIPPKWFTDKYPEDKWEWEQGIMKTTKIGNATLSLIKLKDLLNLYEKHMKQNPDQFYST